MAVMLEQLDVHPSQRVLEIGAGIGYKAALLAVLAGSAGEITTIDIDDGIVREARQHLDAAGHHGVRTVVGDGWVGVPEHAPYDRIEATLGVWELSPFWIVQLVNDGLVVVPPLTRPWGAGVRGVSKERRAPPQCDSAAVWIHASSRAACRPPTLCLCERLDGRPGRPRSGALVAPGERGTIPRTRAGCEMNGAAMTQSGSFRRSTGWLTRPPSMRRGPRAPWTRCPGFC